MNSPFQGILPALVSPLNSDGTVNLSAFEKLIERVYTAGVDGLYVCGSTGEGLLLPVSERRKLAEAAVRNSPEGKTVIVHVGSHSLADSQALARHAGSKGAAGVSSLRPAGSSYEEMLDYYRQLAAVCEVPFLAYYFPAAGGGTLSVEQLEAICALPGVAGLKFTDYDLYTLSLLIREGKIVFNGRDEVLAAGLLMGANGGIGSIYNLVPGWFVELYGHARCGRWAQARAMQDRINDLIRVLLAFPFLPALKCYLGWEGIACGPALGPQARLTDTQEAELRRALTAIA